MNNWHPASEPPEVPEGERVDVLAARPAEIPEVVSYLNRYETCGDCLVGWHSYEHFTAEWLPVSWLTHWTHLPPPPKEPQA